MADITQRTFNAGEVCEDAWARNDIAQLEKGFRLGQNGVCLVQGPIEKRKGFWFAGEAKTAGAFFRLKAFTRKSRQTVVLELGAGYVRVWGLDRQRVGAFEVVTPFALDEIVDLRFTQSGDIMYVFRRNHKRPQVLKRLDTLVWTCTDWSCRNGPWLPDFEDDGLSLTFSAGHLVASAAYFSASHLGALLRAKPPNGYVDRADGWRSEWQPTTGELGEYAGNYYLSSNAGGKKCGNNPPIHTKGTIRDGTGTGAYGVDWAFLYTGRTTFSIAAVNSAVDVTVAGLDGVCLAPGDITKWWTEGAYSDYRGWPSMAPCIHYKRFVTGCTTNNASTIDLSQVQGFGPGYADYTDGKSDGTIEPDDAVRFEVTGSGAELQWSVSFGPLFVGADDGVWQITSGSTNKAITPSENIAELVGPLGAEPIMPAVTPESLIYVAINGQILCAISDPSGQLDYDPNIGLLFEHLTGRVVKQVIYLKAPLERLVLRLGDGGFAFVTYNRKQGVIAATTQTIAGCTVLWVESVPGADGVDQLWIALARGNQRLIAVMAGPNEDMYLDLAEQYTGATVEAIGGLDHLKGATVTARGDGRWYKDLVVGDDAFVRLPSGYGVSNAVIGLPIDFRFEDMPSGAFPRSLSTVKSQIKTAAVTVRGTAFRIGSTSTSEGDSEFMEDYLEVSGETNLPIERHITHKAIVAGWRDFDKRLLITDQSPFALKIFGVTAGVE